MDGDRLHGAGSACISALQGCCSCCWPLSHVNASKRPDLYPLPRAEEIRESDIGTGAGLFEVLKIGDEFFTFIVDCKQPKACSILLRGASKDVLNEVRSACNAAGPSTLNILCPVQYRVQCRSGTCRVSGSVHWPTALLIWLAIPEADIAVGWWQAASMAKDMKVTHHQPVCDCIAGVICSAET